MHKHPALEVPYFVLRKYCELLPANRQHRFTQNDSDFQRIAEGLPECNGAGPRNTPRTNTNQAPQGQYGGGWSVSPVNDCKPPRTR